MSQIQFPQHSGIRRNESIAISGAEAERARRRLRVLQVLGVVVAILAIIWVIQKPMTPAATRDLREGDLASALLPILAIAIGINLFIDLGAGFFEHYDPTLVAHLGHGQRWLKQAQVEVLSARQFHMDAYEHYSNQMEKLHKFIEQVTETESPAFVVENASTTIKLARNFLDLAESRVSIAEHHLGSLVDHSSYRRFKWLVITYFCILLGLLVATATSMQIFAIMGIQLGIPKLDMVLTGLFIGGLVYPVHQVIGNIWDILTKLAKK